MYTHVCMYVYIYIYTHTYMYRYMCMCVCVYVYVPHVVTFSHILHTFVHDNSLGGIVIVIVIVLVLVLVLVLVIIIIIIIIVIVYYIIPWRHFCDAPVCPDPVWKLPSLSVQ